MKTRRLVVSAAIALGVWLIVAAGSSQTSLGKASVAGPAVRTGSEVPALKPASTLLNGVGYTVLAWNDLGMHCYNRDFQYIAVLPPYNTLWAQVIKIGDPPQIITTGITVTYEIIDNSFSVGKSNFWTYDQDLYGVDLPPNVGLAWKGLSGTMDLHLDHFVAEGIPLTEFRDSDYAANPLNPVPYPYMLAKVVVLDAATGAVLAETTPVAPVSTEMHCDECHSDGRRRRYLHGLGGTQYPDTAR